MFNSVRVASGVRPSAVVVGVFTDKKLDGRGQSPGCGRIDRERGRAGRVHGRGGKIAEAFPTGKGRGGAGDRRGAGELGEKFDVAVLRKVGRGGGAAAGRDEGSRGDHRAGRGDRERGSKTGRAVLGEGLGLVAELHRSEGKGSEPKKRTDLKVSADGKAFEQGMEMGLGLAESANFCRDLSETPPNIATPDYIARQAKTLAKKTGLKCTVFDGDAIRKERFTGLENVGKASENKPCLIRLEYRPKNVKAGTKPVVLVGKTMTYDTGGLSLKVNNSMVGMKRDKDGGARVLERDARDRDGGEAGRAGGGACWRRRRTRSVTRRTAPTT